MLWHLPTSACALIKEREYGRQRLNPSLSDALYLHLSDLRLAMGRVATNGNVRVLDFGCGGSPYRCLFPNAEYVRADIEGAADIDVVIPSGSSKLPIPDRSFDVILSTQVLEHVPEPREYLDECRRLLRPDGRLVLTTHGTFVDHGCPNDFYRWTHMGLRRDLIAAGFRIDQMWKLTTGLRAALFLLQSYLGMMAAASGIAILLWPVRYVATSRPWWWHRQCDRVFADCRVVDDLDKHLLYIGLCCIAVPNE
jgi:SAM-dependent methyltransferase